MQETLEMWVWSLGWENHLEEEMATHYSDLVWKILWTEEPGGLQSVGKQRIGYNWAHTLAAKIDNPVFASQMLKRQLFDWLITHHWCVWSPVSIRLQNHSYAIIKVILTREYGRGSVRHRAAGSRGLQSMALPEAAEPGKTGTDREEDIWTTKKCSLLHTTKFIWK